VTWLSQLAVVTGVVVRTLPQRAGWSVAATTGIALVVAVMVAVFSIAEGFRNTLASTGSPENAMVLRSGTDSEMSSNLDLDAVRVIEEGPGIRRDAQGTLASAELFVIVDLPKRSAGTEANVPLRGVEPEAFAVRDRVRIVEGRRFEPGKSELIAGRGAAETFAGLDVGSVLRWGDSSWTVVGIFEADGSLSESELWCDVRVLQPAYRRPNNFQSVYAKLESPAAFTAFKDSLTTDPRLKVRVVREDEYYAAQSEVLYGLITGLGTIVTALMAVGAVFGAVITMYSAVSARTREIATLRALGFAAGPVVASVLVEALVLALAGGALGAGCAYGAFNGLQAATLNWQSFSQVVFAFSVTPALMLQALVVSCVLGLLGGLLPAVRAARLPIATALREL
jgi:putative ABC transport system permease protein